MLNGVMHDGEAKQVICSLGSLKKISVDKDIQPAVFDDGREGGKQVNASLKA